MLAMGEDLGFAEGSNRAAASAAGDLLALLNSDALRQHFLAVPVDDDGADEGEGALGHRPFWPAPPGLTNRSGGRRERPLESRVVEQDWRQQIVETYERSLARHGPTIRALRWVSEESQVARFSVLAEAGPLAGASLLDIGCGLGDLFGFLRQHGLDCEYTGYDITPGMLDGARAKYPEGRFELRDILTEGLGGSFDYVMASGTFNVRVPDHESWLARMLETMYAGCRRAVAFNILRPLPAEKQPPEPFATWAREFYYEVEPPALVDACRRLTPAVEVREGYLPAEYTLYLRREGPAITPG